MDHELNTAAWAKRTFHTLVSYHFEIARRYESTRTLSQLPALWEDYFDARCRFVVGINDITSSPLDFEKAMLVNPNTACRTIYSVLLCLITNLYCSPSEFRRHVSVTDGQLAALHHRIVDHCGKADEWGADGNMDYDDEGRRRLEVFGVDDVVANFVGLADGFQGRAREMMKFIVKNPRTPPPEYEPPPPSYKDAVESIVTEETGGSCGLS